MMIALTCHIYFDVPSKDHMLCPYNARHKKGMPVANQEGS